MTYTISQISKMTRLTPYTLRYYDREGLLPFVSRNNAGVRVFSEHDLEMVNLICCLKSTGMPVKQIRAFIDWYVMGDSTLEKRRDMFLAHRRQIIDNIEELQRNLTKIEEKLRCYNDACDGRTASVDVCMRSAETSS